MPGGLGSISSPTHKIGIWKWRISMSDRLKKLFIDHWVMVTAANTWGQREIEQWVEFLPCAEPTEVQPLTLCGVPRASSSDPWAQWSLSTESGVAWVQLILGTANAARPGTFCPRPKTLNEFMCAESRMQSTDLLPLLQELVHEGFCPSLLLLSQNSVYTGSLHSDTLAAPCSFRAMPSLPLNLALFSKSIP